MKGKLIGYWICTVVVALSLLSGGVFYVLRVPQVVEGVTRLGFPIHFIVLLGFWKLLGGIAILVPGFPLLKEWAYAGIIFDLTGAAVATAATGGEVRHIVVPLVMALVVIASWALRPESRRLRPRDAPPHR